MDTQNPLSKAIASVGLALLSRELGVTYQAVRLWEKRGRMPRTEWTGETTYSETIERLTDRFITKAQLLSPWPKADLEPAAQGSAERSAA